MNQEKMRAMMTNHGLSEIFHFAEPVTVMMKAVTSEPSFFDSFDSILTFEVFA